MASVRGNICATLDEPDLVQTTVDVARLRSSMVINGDEDSDVKPHFSWQFA
jgi:hypothetical protein